MGPLFTLSEKSEYHDNLLLVKMQPVTQAPGAIFPATFAGGVAASHVLTQGISALSFYERAGMVRKVTPISSRRPQFASTFALANADSARIMAAVPTGQRAAAALSAAAIVGGDANRPDTSSVVELDPGANLQELKLALASDPMVSSVSLVPRRYLAVNARPARSTAANAGIAAVPPSAQSMWNLQAIRWAQARSKANYKEPVTIKVAVLDTGIDQNHPDLQAQIKSYTYAYPDLQGAYSGQDLIGHGTHVAGTIAASIGNNLGINGICKCEIHAWKIFDDTSDFVVYPNGMAAFVYYVDPLLYRRALLECADSDMDVVNLSIGGGGPPDPDERDSFGQLIQGGTTVVAAMGNDRQNGSPTSYPAAIDGVIAVGASNIQDRITNFSNRGNHITLCAPGDAIWSTLPTYAGQTGWSAIKGADGKWRESKPEKREVNYDAWPGTSMASPHVAAAAAVYLANGGARDPAAVQKALAMSADKVAAMQGATFNADYGHGRLNLERLVEMAGSTD